MKKVKIPTRYIRIAPQSGTVLLRGEGGLFQGRRAVRGFGDRTREMQLKQSVDLNKDGRISDNERGGVLIGRTIRGSNRSRAYLRRSL